MQHPNYCNPSFNFLKYDDVRAIGMKPNRWSELFTHARDLRLLTQQTKQVDHSVEIAISLINTPTLNSIEPDGLNVMFGERV
jgi:hypothetical protein